MTFNAAETILPTDDILAGWFGPEPRLATADELASRVDVYLTSTGFGYPAIVLEATDKRLPTLDISVQMRVAAPTNYLAIYLQRLDVGSLGTSLLLSEEHSAVYDEAPKDVWRTHTFHLTAGVDYDQGEVEAALAAGELAVLGDVSGADLGGFGEFLVAQWSQIAVGGVETYLRNHQRDDGLGANAPRNHGATSRQGSIRNHGYR